MDAAARGVRERPPELDALLDHLRGLRVVGDPADGRPCEQEVRAKAGIDVLSEAAHHPGHVLHPVPARDLDDERRVGGWWRPGLQHVDPPVDPSRRTVAAGEWNRRHVSVAPEQTRVAEDQADVSL
jgi:hypothetical protein